MMKTTKDPFIGALVENLDPYSEYAGQWGFVKSSFYGKLPMDFNGVEYLLITFPVWMDAQVIHRDKLLFVDFPLNNTGDFHIRRQYGVVGGQVDVL